MVFTSVDTKSNSIAQVEMRRRKTVKAHTSNKKSDLIPSYSLDCGKPKPYQTRKSHNRNHSKIIKMGNNQHEPQNHYINKFTEPDATSTTINDNNQHTDY